MQYIQSHTCTYVHLRQSYLLLISTSIVASSTIVYVFSKHIVCRQGQRRCFCKGLTYSGCTIGRQATLSKSIEPI